MPDTIQVLPEPDTYTTALRSKEDAQRPVKDRIQQESVRLCHESIKAYPTVSHVEDRSAALMIKARFDFWRAGLTHILQMMWRRLVSRPIESEQGRIHQRWQGEVIYLWLQWLANDQRAMSLWRDSCMASTRADFRRQRFGYRISSGRQLASDRPVQTRPSWSNYVSPARPKLKG